MSDAQTIIDYLTEELLDGEDIDADTSLFRSQLLDSMGLTSLILFIEERFGIRVGPMDISYDNLDTVNLMLAFIERRRDAHA